MARPLLALLHLSCASTALQVTSSTSQSAPTAGMASSAAADVVETELFPFIRVYKSGRVERLLGTDTVPASLDASTGVASKDVVIDPATGVSVRLYLPPAAAASGGEGKKLPVLVYFHGGGFMVETAAAPTYHRYLNALAARAGALAVSVEYRRVPEHPLPAAYDDSWAALAWAVAGSAPGGPEPWLAAHGDASRVFLAGDSAGANIAHNVALRAAAEGLPRPCAAIVGVLLVHPYFWDPTNAMAPALEVRIRNEWRIMCARPDAGVDDPRFCPTCAVAAPRLAALPGKRAMVAVAGDDFLAVKGRAYHAALLASGWRGEAELVDTPGQDHVFHLMRPGTEAAADMLDRVAGFISRA
ncbi:tuliposide A-converting enzyme 1, chloroplastic-like [Triticum urartu]|uniref:Alpha/beta hydrolase fold-3 domain-containing protein n=1 Tax=Triticum urartu TaxID=4572 RepID=A0A8R7JW19_TRIUA|nr:tuliposide A-converting enzyme 1, chloroplastic-like [Triticum urartu]XP_048566676.1 tuliposide A-converting enzyme 1, chloroplastic-like [Triticum urartu]